MYKSMFALSVCACKTLYVFVRNFSLCVGGIKLRIGVYMCMGVRLYYCIRYGCLKDIFKKTKH